MVFHALRASAFSFIGRACGAVPHREGEDAGNRIAGACLALIRSNSVFLPDAAQVQQRVAKVMRECYPFEHEYIMDAGVLEAIQTLRAQE